MKLFACTAYNVRRMPVTACVSRLKLLKTASDGSADRMRLEKCVGCAVGACHARGEDAPGVAYEQLEMSVPAESVKKSKAEFGGAAMRAARPRPAQLPKLRVVHDAPRMQAVPVGRVVIGIDPVVGVTLDAPAREPVDDEEDDPFWSRVDAVIAVRDREQQEASMAKVKGERPTTIQCEDCPAKVKVGLTGMVPKVCKPCGAVRGKMKARVKRAANGAKPKAAKVANATLSRPAIPPPALEVKAPRAPRSAPVSVTVPDDSLQLARKALNFVGLQVVESLQSPAGMMLLVRVAGS